MTKEEFLSMLNNELENLEKDYQTALERVNYFKAVNSRSKEFQQAEYQLKMVEQKIVRLRNFLTLPAYARIQAMSEAEIEEYKKGKIEELELKIKEIQAREEQEKEKLSQLKAEQDQLVAQFGSLSGREREIAISKGQQLSVDLTRYDVNNQWGVFANIKREIDKVRKQQEQIKAMTPQEIKQQLSSEIPGSYNLAQKVEWARKPIDAFKELEASIAQDPEKAQQMATLLTYYRRLSDEQSQIKCIMYISLWNQLPRMLKTRLNTSAYHDPKSMKFESRNPDKSMEIIQEFEGSFEQARTVFNEQFTEQKLSKLVGREHGINSSEVDIEFLQQHTDKLPNGELELLQSLVEQRDKLSKKIIKTRNTKSDIANLNSRIKEEQSKIYKEIIGWYNSQNTDLLGISGVSFYSLEALRNGLKRSKEEIDQSHQAIFELRETLRKEKAKMEQQKQAYETKKAEVTQQIRALGGERHKETDIPYVYDSVDDNLYEIASAQSNVYARNVINRVLQEAQNQADKREAELLQMKQETQPKTETAEVEGSHDIKI